VANTNAPFGFRQYSGNGSAPTYEQVAVAITAGASNIFYGDPVTAQSDGSIAQSASTGGSPAAAGIAGVFTGCKYLSTVSKRTVWSNYYPGGSDPVAGSIEGYIVNDPNARFTAQADGTGLAASDVNATVGFVIGSGNTSTGISAAYVDSTTLGTTANNPFRVVSIINAPPGANGTLANGQAYDQVVVAFNNVSTRNLTGV
jgi:hypothetical protein